MMTDFSQEIERAHLALQRGEWPLAERMYRDLTRCRPADAGLWLRLALTLALLGCHRASASAVRHAVCLNPADASTCTVLAQVLLDAKEAPQQQVTALGMATHLAPTALRHAQYAHALFQLGNLDRAMEQCDKALTLEPEQVQAGQTLAAIRQALAEAEKQFKNYLNFLGTETRCPVPYAMFHGAPHELHSGGRLDAMGFRNPVPPTTDKPPGEVRVFVLGDSTMFNGHNDGETVAGRLQTLLNATGHRHYAVYNFAIVSGCLGQMMALLLARLIEFKPDIVIVQAGAINLFAPLTFDPRPGNPYNFYALETLYSRFFTNVEHTGTGLVVRFSEIAKAIISRQASLRSAYGWKTPAWEQSLTDTLAGQLDRLRGLALGFDFKAVFLLQPLIMFKPNLTAAEIKIEVKEDFRDYMHRQYGRLRTRLLFEDTISSPSNPCILQDISNIFENITDDIYEDFIHYNPQGRQLVACRMRDIVLALTAA